MMMFIVLGFGLLLSVYRFASWIGITSAFMVVSIGVQFCPLMLKLWFSVFITGFGSRNPSSMVASNLKNYWMHMERNNIEISAPIVRISLLSCISILCTMTAVIGRLSFMQILKLTLIF